MKFPDDRGIALLARHPEMALPEITLPETGAELMFTPGPFPTQVPFSSVPSGACP